MAAAITARRALGSLAVSALLALIAGCHRGGDAGLPLTIEVSQRFAAEPLQLQQSYTLANGDSLSVDRLRYYLSNFRLHRADGTWSAAARSEADARGYFLVDASEVASQRFVLEGLSAGGYDGIEFLIGVDEARNHQGAQTGALDPARGMFWTWNTGYIFFKLEGHSPQSTASGQSVIYHIGGSSPQSLARKAYLPLGEKPLKLEERITGTVHLHFDLAALFGGQSALSLAQHNNIMEAREGLVVADRYAQAFRVDHIHHEPRQ